MNNPKISVVIPVFNTERYLNTCLNSVINQTFSNIEIIIINDGSTDTSAQICQSYAENDSRITFVDKDNEGVSITRNIGINMSSGDWLYFLDSDDFLELDAFECLLKFCIKTKCDIIHFGARQLKNRVVVNEVVYPKYHEYENLKLFFSNNYTKPTPASLTLVNSDIVKNNEILFNEDMKHNEDLLFVYSLYCHTEKIVVLDKIIYNQVLSENSTSRKPINIKVLEDRINFLSNLCDYTRQQGLIAEYKTEINELSKYIFVLAAYYNDFYSYKKQIKNNLRLLYSKNKDIFDTKFFKVAIFNIDIVLFFLRISHKVRKINYVQ